MFMKQKIYILAIVLATAMIDFLSKQYSLINFKKGIEIFDWFKLIYTENYGMAFGINIPGELLLIFNIIFLTVLIAFLFQKFDYKKPLAYWTVGLLIGGAVGNIIDRITKGFVIDFISVGFWPVFNLADAFITIAIFSIIIFYGKIIKNN